MNLTSKVYEDNEPVNNQEQPNNDGGNQPGKYIYFCDKTVNVDMLVAHVTIAKNNICGNRFETKCVYLNIATAVSAGPSKNSHQQPGKHRVTLIQTRQAGTKISFYPTKKVNTTATFQATSWLVNCNVNTAVLSSKEKGDCSVHRDTKASMSNSIPALTQNVPKKPPPLVEEVAIQTKAKECHKQQRRRR
jgi:hypothetical protein